MTGLQIIIPDKKLCFAFLHFPLNLSTLYFLQTVIEKETYFNTTPEISCKYYQLFLFMYIHNCLNKYRCTK